MSKSLWSIVVLGFITVVIMMVMMLVSLTAYQRSPAAKRAQFSNMIRENLGFPEVGAEVRSSSDGLTLRIEYLSHLDSNFDEEQMQKEMDRVVAYAKLNYPGKDRPKIVKLQLRRTEIRGKGCWTRTLEREMSVEQPFAKPAEEAPPPEDP